MRDRLVALLETADLALGSCSGVVDHDTLNPLIASVSAVRTRISYPDGMLVVALAGGTGSGKSSLFNAIVEEDLVEVGGIRPTTSAPAVAVPRSAAGSVEGYLDDLEIDVRHLVDIEGFCLIDLPDTDSVELAHRHRVNRILPLVDVVVWVSDPEKYSDARLHHDYLVPLADYSDQFIFVLNQVDRLRPGETEAVTADYRQTLVDSGVQDPLVVITAAAPPFSPPEGIAELVAAIDGKRSSRGLYRKLLTDVANASRTLSRATGRPLDFDRRAAEAVAIASGHLTNGDLGTAIEGLVGFLDNLAAESGGPSSIEIRRLGAEVPRHLDRINTAVEAGRPAPSRRWRRRHTKVEGSKMAGAEDPIVEAVIRPVRVILAKRALAIASVVDLAVEVEGLARDSSR